MRMAQRKELEDSDREGFRQDASRSRPLSINDRVPSAAQSRKRQKFSGSARKADDARVEQGDTVWPAHSSGLRKGYNDTWNAFQRYHKGRAVSTEEWKVARLALWAEHERSTTDATVEWPSTPRDLRHGVNDTWNAFQRHSKGATVTAAQWRTAKAALWEQYEQERDKFAASARPSVLPSPESSQLPSGGQQSHQDNPSEHNTGLIPPTLAGCGAGVFSKAKSDSQHLRTGVSAPSATVMQADGAARVAGVEGRHEKSKMLAGELYNAADAMLSAERKRCQGLLAQLNALPIGNEPQRAGLIRKLFGRVPEQPGQLHANTDTLPHLEPTFRCDYGYNISVGNNFYCNFDCCILDCCAVTIGDDVFFGPRVQVWLGERPWFTWTFARSSVCGNTGLLLL